MKIHSLVIPKTLLVFIALGLAGCLSDKKEVTSYLEGCCNFVSAGFCLNDYSFEKIHRNNVRDFTLTSVYDKNGKLAFSVYEGNNPSYDNGDSLEILKKDDATPLKFSKLANTSNQFLVEIDDGNTPRHVHFMDVANDYKDLLFSDNLMNRSIYFRTEPEYMQSPECSYDLSIYR